MSKIKILFFLIPILLILFFWKNTLFNISDQLYDWNDTLYYIWVIQNHIQHFTTFEFNHLFDSSAMYPFKYPLSFGEQFLFPSLIVLFISQFNQNPIFQFNILLVLNHILIFVSFFLLIGLFVKNFWSRIIPSFYIAFSPYIFVQLGHLHMLFFWPLLLSLFFLFKDKTLRYGQGKNLFLTGIFLGLQFMSSIYLGIMGLVAIFLYFAVRLFFEGKRRVTSLFKEAIIILTIFLIIAGISIYGYMLARNEYGGRRDIREFIIYSAHLSDYIFFTRNQSSIFYNILAGKWDYFDHHNWGEKAAFIGIIPSIIITFYLFKLTKDKTSFRLSIQLNKFSFFLIFLGLVSFIFSLGPRLNVNGEYLHIPLPYYFILKLPFVEVLRGLARWFFLVTLAAAILIGLGLDKFFENLTKKISARYTFIIGFLIFNLFIIEFYPKPLPASTKQWWDKSYEYMKSELCMNTHPAVLEYPFIYRNHDANIIKDLQYKMVTLLASTQHSCKILGGFSGYEPPKYIEIREQLDNNGIDQKDLNLVKNLGFSYLKINKFALSKEEAVSLTKDLDDFKLKSVYKDEKVNIYAL